MKTTYTVSYGLPGGTPRQAQRGLDLRTARRLGMEYAQGKHGCPWLRGTCRDVEITRDADGSHVAWC